ncbi:MAG: dihydroxyacetone kinase subunit L, partial [Rhodospirillaceae bacterium]|nr:dihydroxyacetone kinase subunit L [Rhodospirillaceae bacterium]
MQELTKIHVLAWLSLISVVINKNATNLCNLDAAIGDGDHGANMSRGFTAVTKKLETVASTDNDIGKLFKIVGMTLLSTVGGAAGPLYGGFFLELGRQSANKHTLDAASLFTIIAAGLDDIKRRGKAELGDKTMVDALAPAVDVMGKVYFKNNLVAAKPGGGDSPPVSPTKKTPMFAKKWRAQYKCEP